MLSCGTKCHHLEQILPSGANVIIWSKCDHVGLNVIIWDEMLSSGANVIICDSMLSSGAMLSFGTKCHLVIFCPVKFPQKCNVIIWYYNVCFFLIPENFTHSIWVTEILRNKRT
jgi:hypothetical protein